MRNVFIASAVIISLAGCGSQPPAPEQSPAGVDSATPNEVVTQPVANVTPTAFDAMSVAALKDPRSPLSKRIVYFDLDSYVVKAEYQTLLTSHGKFLADNGKMKMLIQGSGDERGSREYNLALAQKRADAVKKSLALLGARDDQMEAVSLEKKSRFVANRLKSAGPRIAALKCSTAASSN